MAFLEIDNAIIDANLLESKLQRIVAAMTISEDPIVAGTKRMISLGQLFSYDGSEFIEQAYYKILGRKVDECGRTYYLELLEKKHISKEEIIYHLCISEEGEKRNIFISDFKASKLKLSHLMKYDGERFVENAYYWILGRESDEEGRRYYVEKLKKNVDNKLEILFQITRSIEGRSRNIKIPGLRKKYCLYKVKNKIREMPVLGNIVFSFWFFFTLKARISSLSEQMQRIDEELKNVDSFGRVKIDSLDKEIQSLNYRVIILESSKE